MNLQCCNYSILISGMDIYYKMVDSPSTIGKKPALSTWKQCGTATALEAQTIPQHLLASTSGQGPRSNFRIDKIPEKTGNVLQQHYSKLFVNLLVSFLNRKLHRILFSHSHKK